MRRHIVILSALGVVAQSCAVVLGATAGPTLLATPRTNTPYGGTLNVHLSVGSPIKTDLRQAFLVGTELNFRASNDYGHGGFGFSGMYLFSQQHWATYFRLGIAPIAGSNRGGVIYYSLNTGLEWGVAFPLGNTARDELGQPTEAHALLLTVRGDLDARPAQGFDLFGSINIGYTMYILNRGSARRLPIGG